MHIDIRVPEVGESVTEGILVQWFKQDGDRVRKGELLYLLETDKITLEINAEADGVLRIRVPEGRTVAVGAVIAVLEADSVTPLREEAPADKGPKPVATETVSPPRRIFPEPGTEAGVSTAAAMGPSVRRLAEEKGVDVSRISGTGPGGRITRGDVLLFLEESGAPEEIERPAVSEAPPAPSPEAHPHAAARLGPEETETRERISRKPMSPIRQRIAERLVAAKQTTATLTTFNEIDMSRVQEIRGRFKEAYRERHGVTLGIMSFFVKATVEALKAYPEVNAFIEETEVVYHEYYHIGIAVGGGKGLVVPVIRHADRLTFGEIEQSIAAFVSKIRENRLELSDLEGGTFTITNGGIYGSLLSTPLLNFPQSAILGMHRIDSRPVAVGGEVVVRPMMYVALTYDHRLVDGREAVSFLKRIKECVEDPERIMLEI